MFLLSKVISNVVNLFNLSLQNSPYFISIKTMIFEFEHSCEWPRALWLSGTARFFPCGESEAKKKKFMNSFRFTYPQIPTVIFLL